MIPIDIVLTENPIVDTAMTPIANVRREALVSGITFTKAAQGGDVSASWDMECDEETAFRFLNDYLGKRVVFIHPDGIYTDVNLSGILWQGFVYTVGVETDGLSISRSLQDVYNRVDVSYTELNVNAVPVQTSGQNKRIGFAEDASSQLKYGTRHMISAQGKIAVNDPSANHAVALRNTLLSELKDPAPVISGRSATGSTGSSGSVRVSVDCVGIWETLDKRFWSDESTTSSNLSTIIGEITAPVVGINKWGSDSMEFITNNSVMQYRYVDPNSPVTAQDAINRICALGDATQSVQWIFGFRPDRKRYYRALSYAPKYIRYRKDPQNRFYDATTGEQIPSYLVEPGNVIYIPDLLPDGIKYDQSLRDARWQMLGSVTFTEPDTLTWQPRSVTDAVGVKLSRLAGGYFIGV